jgi:hypothetical protein
MKKPPEMNCDLLFWGLFGAFCAKMMIWFSGMMSNLIIGMN